MASETEPGEGGGLRAARRIASGKIVFPAPPAGTVAARFFEPLVLSPTATLYSYTVLHSGRGAEPLTLIYADFPEGARVAGRLDLPEGVRPEIGMQVQPVTDADIDAVQTYHFRLAGEN